MAKKMDKPAPESSGAALPSQAEMDRLALQREAVPALDAAGNVVYRDADGVVVESGSRAVIPAGSPYTVIHLPAMTTHPHQYPTSLNLSDAADKALFFRALSRPDLNVDELNGQTFRLMNYLIAPAEEVNEQTGEVRSFPRIKLIDPAGRVLETTGMAVASALERLMVLWPNAIGGTGINVTIRKRKSRRPGVSDWHDLVVLPD